VKIGKDDLAIAHQRPLDWLRLFHFDDEIRLAKHRRSIGNNLGPVFRVSLVRNPAASPGPGLVDDAMASPSQLKNADREHGDPVLVLLNFPRHSDCRHDSPHPLRRR